MGKYSIKDLEKLSGIKAHTIRIWEKRYGLIKPERSDTNIRSYCDTELKKLLNVALLNNHGHKISKICKLRHEELKTEIERIVETDSSYETQVDGLIVAMVDLDRRKFERIIRDCTHKIGFEDTCIHILYPFLQKVGVMWLSDSINPAQEHFISSLIIQKLYVAIDGLYHSETSGKKVLFFLKEGELHEMGLLFYRYLFKNRGFETIYLGQSVPLDDLVKTVKAHEPEYIVTAFVASISEEALVSYINQLTKVLPKQQIIVSGQQVGQLSSKLPDHVIKIDKVDKMIAHIESIRA